MVETEIITLDERLAKDSKILALNDFGTTKFGICEIINNYSPTTDEQTAEQVKDALVSTYTTYRAIRTKLGGRFSKRPQDKLFLEMYALYVGASEGLEILDKGVGDGGLQIRTDVDAIPFSDRTLENIMDSNDMNNTLLNLFQTRASRPSVQKSYSLEEFAESYLSFIRQKSLERMDEEQFKSHRGHVKTLTLEHPNGRTVKGLNTGLKTGVNVECSIPLEKIAGYDKQKEELMECATLVKNYERILKNNPRVHDHYMNMIMYGPPGTGKTMMAKAFANACGAPFTLIDASTVKSTYQDGSAKAMEKLLDHAIRYIKEGVSPISLVFIDEADSLLMERHYASNSSERDVTTGNFLLKFGSENQYPGIVAIAATNTIKGLSEAAYDRFGRFIPVPRPNLESRKSIWSYYITDRNNESEMPSFDQSLNIDTLAKISLRPDGDGFTGRDIWYSYAFAQNKVDLQRLSTPTFIGGLKEFEYGISRQKERILAREESVNYS